MSALGGQEGLATCRQTAPDLMITGIVMSVTDGHTRCRQLRQHPATRHLPMLVISGRSEPDVVAAHDAAGANAFLPKPMPAAALLLAVSALLAGSARRGS
jgi:pilus assembly protein CpaE